MPIKTILLLIAMHGDVESLKIIEFNSLSGCEKFKQQINHLHIDYKTGEMVQKPNKRFPLFYSKCVVVEDK